MTNSALLSNKSWTRIPTLGATDCSYVNTPALSWKANAMMKTSVSAEQISTASIQTLPLLHGQHLSASLETALKIRIFTAVLRSTSVTSFIDCHIKIFISQFSHYAAFFLSLTIKSIKLVLLAILVGNLLHCLTICVLVMFCNSCPVSSPRNDLSLFLMESSL